jgi:hypothetical protein
MGIHAEVTLTCDNCERDDTLDLTMKESAEDIIDREGWQLRGILLDRLLCDDCADDEDED